ncbi:periplasmic nitrate reductase subunit NapB [Saccharicrinis carchari]|uniref:Periplasmic nitrate reductase, electron transfer subunit n=1 Tax=Saccharicrinis carchari TaxID=1168039 RepID=A0A521F240_SACCC|nr:nitrate reductase cytochrome c-type subunit [Saccharicrinis carchari]SMO90254.1 periplasmic nitrate reductase subunit NapB [Saccharicrinis carchari]
MKKNILILTTISLFVLGSCTNNRGGKEYIDENKLGLIDADVKSEDTNLSEKPKYSESKPGSAELIDRAYENAPPMIPHTVNGFLPIKLDNNICLTCHLPDKAEESGAVPISSTHFANWRPQPVLEDGVYKTPASDSLTVQNMDRLNNQYFNCNQCHVPQATVSVDIENLFTPEFRQEFGLEKSNLEDQVKEGIN